MGRRILFGLAIFFTAVLIASLPFFITGKAIGDNVLSKMGYEMKIIGTSGGLIFFSILYLLYEKLTVKFRLLNWACLALGITLAICYWLVFLN